MNMHMHMSVILLLMHLYTVLFHTLFTIMTLILCATMMQIPSTANSLSVYPYDY